MEPETDAPTPELRVGVIGADRRAAAARATLAAAEGVTLCEGPAALADADGSATPGGDGGRRVEPASLDCLCLTDPGLIEGADDAGEGEARGTTASRPATDDSAETDLERLAAATTVVALVDEADLAPALGAAFAAGVVDAVPFGDGPAGTVTAGPSEPVAGGGPDLVARLRRLAAPTDPPDAGGAADGPFDDATVFVDARWRVRSAAPAVGDLLDLDPAAAVGSSLWATAPELLGTGAHATCWAAVDADGSTATVPAGAERWLDVEAVPLPGGLAVRFAEATERVSTRRGRDRYERILETIDDGVYTLDENFRITGVNEAVTAMTGYDREELLGAHATLLADEDVLVAAGDVISEILLGEREAGRLDVELTTRAGDALPVETRFSALEFEDGSYGSVGVIRDIGDRKRYERTLTALNRSTRELFRTETMPEVGRLVVDTATAVLDLRSAAVYLYYEAEGVLLPVAWSGAGTPAAVDPGDDVLWRSYAEARPLDVSVDWAAGSAAGRSIPLGDHGLFVVANPDEEGATDRETLTGLLAANARAALDRVSRSKELARRERTLARRNQDLTRLHRFTELIRDVNRALVEAEGREAIESAVCERLAASPLVSFAWIGAYDRGDDRLVPRTWAGAEDGYLDEPPLDAEPSVRAARSGEPVLVDAVSADVQQHPWRSRALARGFQAVASVPLTYNGFLHGVLSVYADEDGAFDDRTLTTLAELGVTTANALSDAQARESLHTEAVVELDLRLPAPNAPLTRVARAAGRRVLAEGTVPQGDGGALCYLAVEGEPVDPATLETVASVQRATLVAERDGGTLLEALVDAPTVAASLADHGATIRALAGEASGVEATVGLSPGVDLRRYVESLREPYPGTELLAKRTHERPVESRRAFDARLEDELTDRQVEALRTAYHSGYFAWPRDRDASEVAASLGITQPTLARHLRVGERKVLAALFDD